MGTPVNMPDGEDTWITFHEPSPALVRARFNITQIEVPSNDIDEEAPELLQMLINEGIPVKVVPVSTDAEEDPSNAGVIMHQSRLEETSVDTVLNIQPNESDENESNVTLLTSLPNIENAIEVTGADKPISTPLYLHYAQILPETSNNSRRVSISLNPDGDILPPKTIQGPPMSVKKSVRFNLPERKGSLIGVYEYFAVPNKTNRNTKGKPSKQKGNCNDRNNENTSKDPKTKIKSSSMKHKDKKTDIDEDLQQKLDNYSLDLNLDSYSDPTNGISSNGLSKISSSENFSLQNFESNSELDSGTDDDSIEEDKGSCGICGWQPKWLQPYARKEVYFFFFCVISLLQGMLYTYSNSVISTLEKRFRLTRRSTGIILAATDLSQVLFGMIIGFYGSRSHIPKMMGIGSMMAGAASLLSALPHFIYGAGALDETLGNSGKLPISSLMSKKITNVELCGRNRIEDCTPKVTIESYVAVPIMMFLSQFTIGLASSIFWTAGLALLDDSVRKRKSPLYLTIFTIVRIIGPTLGFLLGSYCLSLWIDPYKAINISARDSRWLGAWWLGFIVLSGCIMFVGFFYFCFPHNAMWSHNRLDELHNMAESQSLKSRSSQIWSNNNSNSSDSLASISEFFVSLKRIFGNLVWTANLFSNIMFVLAFSGYWKYKPKYIEHQFRKSASTANFYTGMATMVASVIGVGVSGMIIRYTKPRPKLVTGYNVILSVFSIVSLFVMMSLHCTTTELAGHVPQKETWACAKHCRCSEAFHPVCADDGRTVFYSPCYAGCRSVNVLLSPMEYSNCSCIGRVKWKRSQSAKENQLTKPVVEEGWALEGFCPEECKSFLFFIGFQVFTKMVFSTGRVGGTLINLRAVEDRDKALALGCMTTLITLLGFVPASYFFGSIVESSCLSWQETCGERGECWFYDVKKFRFYMHMAPAILLIFSGIGDLIVYLNYDKLNLYEDKEKQLPEPCPSSQKSCLRRSCSTGLHISSQM